MTSPVHPHVTAVLQSLKPSYTPHPITPRRRKSSRAANMAAPSIMAVEVLPKFLLPRLSWGTAVAASRAARPLAVQPRNRTSSLAPFHVDSSARLRRATQMQSPILRREFHATVLRQRDHHFDTLKFVQRLESEGFTEEQSVAMMKVLNDVIEER